MTDLVSVIIPAYNVERYIEKCIDSILKQSYGNVEILLVDDGSSDSTGSICDETAKKDIRVKVFHKNNGGQADARNLALDHMSGDYVTFIDSDDYVSPDYIKRLLRMNRNTGSDISVCGIKGVKENEPAEPESYENELRLFTADEALEQMLRQILFDTEPCAKMYKKELFDEIRFPVGVYTEDLATVYRLFLKADKVSFTKDRLYYYLQRDSSTMGNRANLQRYKDSIDIAEELNRTVSETKPGLSSAAESRMLSVYFQSLAGAEICGDAELSDICWEKIRKHRLKVLLDPKGRPKARVASLISFFGKKAFLSVYEIFVRR